MRKVTFTASPVVWVTIKGAKRTRAAHDPVLGPLPTTRDDDGLVGRFLRWCVDHEVYSAVHAGHSGGGSYAGAFTPADAERVLAWLRAEGAVEDAP